MADLGTNRGVSCVIHRMRAAHVVVLIAGLGVFGCQKDSSAPVSQNEEPTTSASGQKRDSSGSEPPKKIDVVPAPAAAYDIGENGKDGWTEAKLTLASLGSRMDEAMESVGPTMLETVFSFDDPKLGTMRAEPKIMIQDSKTFNVTYALPSDDGETWSLIGDGKRRSSRFRSDWKNLLPFSTSRAITQKEAVSKWPLEFPALMFSAQRDGGDIWRALLSGWEDGTEGYKCTLEEQSFKVGGKVVSHYRVLAKKGGKEPVEAELIVDKARLLPLTIKVNMTRSDDSEFKAVWSGNWKFGGKHDPKSFVIPVPAGG